jgi:hypothetical protein
MKKRNTIAKQQYSESRNDYYKKYCFSQAYDSGITIIELDMKVYQNIEGKLEILCDPSNPKTLWFETYLIMKLM